MQGGMFVLKGFLTGRMLALLLVGLCLGMTSMTGRAAVILTIDISDLRNVTFTPTGAHAENDDETQLYYGFTLIAFFNASLDDSDITYFDESDLYSPGGNFEYTDLTSVDFQGGTNYRDLNIFGSGFSTQDFSTEEAAFTGSAVADLRHWAGFFAAVGTLGSIYSDSEAAYGILLGEYQIVPEPSTVALLVGAGLVGMWYHRRRNRLVA